MCRHGGVIALPKRQPFVAPKARSQMPVCIDGSTTRYGTSLIKNVYADTVTDEGGGGKPP